MKKTLANGAPLTQETFSDFVERLRFDCKGERVNDHFTADAFFLVQHKDRVSGLSSEFTDKRFILDDDSCEYDNPQKWYDALYEDAKSNIDVACHARYDLNFLELEEEDQWDLFVNDEIEDCSVIYYDDEWKTINYHFTYDAAEAFIKRKGHDYGEMRVYTDAHTYGWEYNAIKAALLDGSLVYLGAPEKIETIQSTPVERRRALEAVDALVKSGINFIPVPVYDDADRQALINILYGRMEKLCEVEE